MTVSYVDGAGTAYDVDFGGTGPTTTFGIPRPTAGGALVEGDMLLTSVTWDVSSTTAPNRTLPSGWLSLTGLQLFSASTSYAYTEGIYHFVTAGEAGTTPTWNITPNGGTAMEGNVATSRFRGVDPADPFALTSGTFAGTMLGTGAGTAPSVTTDTADTMVVTGFAIRNGSLTLTDVTPGYTVGGNAFVGQGRSTALAHKLQAAAGATGVANWNLSATSNPKYGWQTALKPAPAGSVEDVLVSRYNGSAWVTQDTSRYNGSTWVGQKATIL